MIGDQAIVSGDGGKSCRDSQVCDHHGIQHVPNITYVPDTYNFKVFEQTSFIEFSLDVALKEFQAERSLGLS